MFRITEDPSSGNTVQLFTKNYKNDSIVSVDMDRVGVMAAYSGPCVQLTVYEGSTVIGSASIYSELHTRSLYAAITQNLSMSTDTIESFL